MSLMPVLFVGHGNPMNAIEDNIFSKGWKEVAAKIPIPKAILCISAHWETWGTLVTALEQPRTIHDFGGFPKKLNEAQYPAPGSSWLAQLTRDVVKKVDIGFDKEWGLDHGCWSVLKQMYPRADIPVVQLSLDYTKPARAHYDLAKELESLRQQGVLIIGSGNMVHNLRLVALREGSLGDFNQPYGFDWALKANALLKELILDDRHQELIDYQSLGKVVQLAVPTPEHYLPLLYTLAVKKENDNLAFFNDQAVGGSVTMTSLFIGTEI